MVFRGWERTGLTLVQLSLTIQTLQYFCFSKSGVRENEKRFVERRRAKETINGGPQMEFIDDLS